MATQHEPVTEMLLHWQELREQGRPCQAQDLCKDHPEALAELSQRIRALESMEAFLGPEAPAPDTPAAGEHTCQSAQDQADQGAAFPHLPGYEILGVLDQGGMGVVYLARQTALRRRVAVKMILAGPHARPEQLARFRTEAEAVAQLRHPNVVQIYDVGTVASQPYFSMEYIEGGSLARHLARALVPARMAAQLTATLAETIHFAHERGVVHRDLKPANVLLETPEARPANSGEDWADLRPKIADFGLAKLGDSHAGDTRTGAVLGTPSYLAPEQAAGNTQAVGPATDVHGLGVILYEMLTGRPPFQGESTLEVLEQVRSQEPTPPRRLRPTIPRDLETICQKCLQKRPADRYASAAALAADLHRFLAGQSILARPTPTWEKALKWVRRKPSQAALFGVTGVAGATLLAGWIGFTAQLKDERDRAIRAEGNAHNQEQLALTNLATAEAERAVAQYQRDVATKQHDRAQALLFHCTEDVEAYARAGENAKEATRNDRDPASILYVLARFYALNSARYRQDEWLPTDDRQKMAEVYAARGVRLLQRASEVGYFDREANRLKLRDDKDLDSLRGRPDFKQFASRMAPKG